MHRSANALSRFGGIAIATCVALAVVASLFFADGADRADAFALLPPTDATNNAGQRLTLNNETVNVRFVSVDAQFANRFGEAVPNPADPTYAPGDLYFVCSGSTPPGTSVDAGTFAGTQELVFYLRTPENPPRTYFSGPGERNFDGRAHARMTQRDATTVRLEWEDQRNLGDADYNDCVIDIIITPLPTFTPTPTDTATSTATPTATATFAPPLVSGVSLSVDPTQAPAGAEIALSDIEDALIEGATQSSPVRSIPVRSIAPETVPVRSIDVQTSPVRSIPVRSILLRGLPLDETLLAQIPIYREGGWSEILKGTSLEGVPPQNVTVAAMLDIAEVDATLPPPALQDVPPAGVDALTLGEIDLRSSPVRSISVAALALGAAPVRSIPVPPNSGDAQADWCVLLLDLGFDCVALGLDVDTTTVMSLEFAGVPIASTIGSVPVRSIDVQASPVRSIPVRSINLMVSPVRSIKLRDLPVGLVDCTLVDCSPASELDLGDAFVANAILPATTLGDVLPFAPPDVTLRDVLLTLLPLDDIAWEEVSLDALLPFAGRELTYTLSFQNTGAGPLVAPQVSIELPAGFAYIAGSSQQVLDAPDPPAPLADPVVAGSLHSWTIGGQVAAGDTFTMTFRVHPSFELGTFTSAAEVTGPGTDDSVDGVAAVQLVESFEPNDDVSPSPPVLPQDVLQISHISFAQDRDLSRIAVPPAGTKISFFVSHIPKDADLDAIAYQPAAAPVRSIPVRSIGLQAAPLPDNGFDADPGDDMLDPDIRQDLDTVRSVPVRSISAQQGTSTETIETASVPGESGFYTSSVTGYNGAHSTSPYVQRYKLSSPPPSPQCASRVLPFAGARATAAPVVPAAVNTIILTSQERLGSLYGTAAASSVMTALNTLAGQTAFGVTGVVVPVDYDNAVFAAYQAWDANPCSPDAANAIVNSVLALVQSIRAANPGVSYIVLAGSDEVIPYARVFDGTTISNEASYATEIASLSTSAIAGSMLTGHVLSDDRYGDGDPIAWLGRELYVPDMAVGRLVETPQDIIDAVSRFGQFQGLLDTATTNDALTTGYDFLSDGANAVGDAFDARPGAPPAERLINETWDRNALLASMFGAPLPGVIAPNAHYNHFQLLPAAGNASPGTADLVTTADVPSQPDALLGRLLFTMGCHAGLNVPDVIVTSPSPGQAASLADWAQTYAKAGAAGYVGNTGYGYGDTLSVAYSERLMQLFAQRLDGGLTIGQAMTFAKQEYFASLGAYGEYDLKAMSEAVFYGLPMYRIDTGVAGPARSLASVQQSASLLPDAQTGLPSQSVVFTPNFELVDLPDGDYYTADGLPPQITHYRPPMPRVEADVTSPDPSLMAHGVLITDLSSQNINGFDPAITRPQVDLAVNEPAPEFGSFAFPGSPAVINTFNSPEGAEQRLVVIPAHFETDGDPQTPPPTGTLRLDDVETQVLYSDSDDWTPPVIGSTRAFTSGSFVSFAVDATDDSGEPLLFVGVLWTAGDGDWQLLRLVRTPGTDTYTGGTQVPSGQEIRYYVQGVDGAGNAGVHGNKALLNRSVPVPAPASEFDVSVSGPQGDNGWFIGAATVTVAGADEYEISIDGATPQTYSGPFAVNGDGVRLIEIAGINGAATSLVVPVDTAAPLIALRTPEDGGVYGENIVVPADFDCSDGGSGVVACDGTTADGGSIDTGLGPHSFTVSARDASGREAQLVAAYSAVSCSFSVDPAQLNTDRDLIDLSPQKPYDDLTRANSDGVNNVCDDDDDNDGLDDAVELGVPCETASGATDPLREDSDGDRSLDGAECALGFDPASAASAPPLANCGPDADSDGDGVRDRTEFCYYNTSTTDVNTDGDNCRDGHEIASINGDREVNVIDLHQIASAVSVYLSPLYIVDFDINKNGEINVMDLQLTVLQYGYCS